MASVLNIYGSSTINWSALFCGQVVKFSLKIINPATLQANNPISIIPGVVTNIGVIDACQSQASNLISLNLDGTNHLFIPGAMSIQPNETYVYAYSQSHNGWLLVNSIQSSFHNFPRQNFPSMFNINHINTF